MKIIRYFVFSSCAFIFLSGFGVVKINAQVQKAEPQIAKNITDAK